MDAPRTTFALGPFEISLKRREDGAWVKDIPEFMDLELKVRGSGNRLNVSKIRIKP